jgi:RNA 3'-terminal phosphate cyclase (ATP)
MDSVFIDGSSGEGGGQILRTSLTLACITGKSLRIENIRAARRNPGLARQHLSCVRAAVQICNGQCTGDELGSQALDFRPGPVQSGEYFFDIGSAGSASLVIQTVLPALFLADKSSKVTVTGGTHNPLAPPFDFLRESFLPAIAVGGFFADCEIIKHGFFPAGGGKINFQIRPHQSNTQQAIELCEPLEKPQIQARIYTARLPSHIAERQRKLLLESGLSIEKIEHVEVTDSDGPGNCIILRLIGSGRTTVFTAFGQRGKPSQKVVGQVLGETRDFLTGGASVDIFLADQLLIYLAVSNKGCFTTGELSRHLLTNIETIKKFLPVDFDIRHENRPYKIICLPRTK